MSSVDIYTVVALYTSGHGAYTLFVQTASNFMRTENIFPCSLRMARISPMIHSLFVLIIGLSVLHAADSDRGGGKIMLIRHGEKSAKSKTGDVHLNQRGEIRSAALAHLFFPEFSDSFLVMANMTLPRIDTVIAQSATAKYQSRRKLETAEPIAKLGGIPLIEFDHEAIHDICDHVRKEAIGGKTSLVVWDHSTVSDIANDLLQIPRGTVRWPMDRYDVIWVIDLELGTLVQFCQHLLFGDLWCPLNPIQVHPVTNAFLRSLSNMKGYTPIMA